MAKRKSAKGKINDLQRKHYTESYRMSNTNPTKTVEGVGGGGTHLLRKSTSYYSTSDTCRVTDNQHEHHLIRKSCWTRLAPEICM